jgi:hypothetical protein
MPRYRVLLEQLSEQEVIIEADSATEAVDLALDGQGEYETEFVWAPTPVLTEELV